MGEMHAHARVRFWNLGTYLHMNLKVLWVAYVGWKFFFIIKLSLSLLKSSCNAVIWWRRIASNNCSIQRKLMLVYYIVLLYRFMLAIHTAMSALFTCINVWFLLPVFFLADLHKNRNFTLWLTIVLLLWRWIQHIHTYIGCSFLIQLSCPFYPDW